MKITDLLGQEWGVDCLGCAIGASRMEPPGGIIAENDTCYVHQDPLVPLEGFLVVATRRHIRSFAEMTAAEHSDFASLLRLGSRALGQTMGGVAFSVVQEEASSHFHLWFFPWLDWIVERYGSTSLGQVRPAMEHAIRGSNTPTQRARVLEWAARAKQAAQREGDAK